MSRMTTVIKTTSVLAMGACLLLVSLGAAQKSRPAAAQNARPRIAPAQAGQPSQAGPVAAPGAPMTSRNRTAQSTRRTVVARRGAAASGTRGRARASNGPGTATLPPVVLPPGRVAGAGTVLYLDAAGVLSAAAPAADSTVDSTKFYRYPNTVGWPR